MRGRRVSQWISARAFGDNSAGTQRVVSIGDDLDGVRVVAIGADTVRLANGVLLTLAPPPPGGR